jgi:hypothetical protein
MIWFTAVRSATNNEHAITPYRPLSLSYIMSALHKLSRVIVQRVTVKVLAHFAYSVMSSWRSHVARPIAEEPG